MSPRRLAALLLLSAGCMEGHKPNPVARTGARPLDARGEIQAVGEGKKKSLYERMGGEAGVHKLVDDFCVAVVANPNYPEAHKKHFREDDGTLKKKLIEQFGEEAGGPQKYTGKSMKDAHKGLGITEADFAALVDALTAALKQNNVRPDDQKEFLIKLARFKDDVVEAGPKQEP